MTTSRLGYRIILIVIYVMGILLFGMILYGIIPHYYPVPGVSATPQVIIVTIMPKPTATPAITPTPIAPSVVESVIHETLPTAIPCTPDDIDYWDSDHDDLKKIESAQEVTWLFQGRSYGVFLINDTGEQVCISLDDGYVRFMSHYVNDHGLSDISGYDSLSSWEVASGKATIEYYGQAVRLITIESPKVTGPNDEAFRLVLPEQIRRINIATAHVYKEPVFDQSFNYASMAPGYVCFLLGLWERIVPLPREISYCGNTHDREIFQWPGESVWLTDIPQNNPFSLRFFWFKPTGEYFHPNEPVRFEDAGPLTVGQQLYDLTVLGTCGSPSKSEIEESNLRNPVTVSLTGFPAFIVPESAYVGVGPLEGDGWVIYRVCP